MNKNSECPLLFKASYFFIFVTLLTASSATLDFSGPKPTLFPLRNLLSFLQQLKPKSFQFSIILKVIFPCSPFQTLDSRCSTWLHIKVDYQLEPNIIHLFPEKHNHQDLLLYHNIERPQTYRLDNA